MKKKIALLLLVTLSVASLLLMRTSSPPASVHEDEGGVPFAPTGPLYPFWTIADLPEEVVPGPTMPKPTATGVHISWGYLLAPMLGMGEVANDFGRDPTVRVLEGEQWRTGRYVDRDTELGVALIRVNLQGPTVVPAPDDGPADRIVTLRMSATGRFAALVTQPRACDGALIELRRGGIARTLMRCYDERVPGFAGGMMLDREGRFIGIQVNDEYARVEQGPGISALREYVSLYAKSWGSGAALKPHL